MILATNLSLSYIRNHKSDSALIVAERGMKTAQSAKDENNYYNLGKIHSSANFYLKDYNQAMDSLLKFSSRFSDYDLADNYYMIGKMYQYQNNYQLTISYFKKIDSIHKQINEPFPELKEVYNELFKYASSKGDGEKQLYYIDKLIAVDSLLDFTYTSINDKIRLDYDLPMLRKEKQTLKTELDTKQQFLMVTLGLVFILIAFVVYYYVRQRTFKKRLQQLIEQDMVKIADLEISNPQIISLGISETVVNDILKNLDDFEQSKRYVSNDTTLHSLSKDFKTNSTYLSMVINHVKQVNFATYLKDLRITNAINTIKKNKKYLKYAIHGLADEFGFTTAESFSSAFKTKTGIKTSYFLDELRKEVKNNT